MGSRASGMWHIGGRGLEICPTFCLENFMGENYLESEVIDGTIMLE